MEYFGVIYKRINRTNGKVYIGQCRRDHNKRWLDCVSSAKHFTTHLANAIKFWGAAEFNSEIIYYAKGQHELDKMETFFIILHQSHKPEFGYNMTLGGEGGLLTEEGRKNLSKSKMGNNRHLRRTYLRICYTCFNSFNAICKVESVFCSRKCCDRHRSHFLLGKPVPGFKETHINARGKPSWNSGKTFVELYGEERAKELIKHAGDVRRGKLFTTEHREKISTAHKNRRAAMAGGSLR